MNRWLLTVCLLLGLATPVLLGAEQKGSVRKIDKQGKQLTIDVAGVNKSFEVASDASIVRQEAGNKKKPATIRVIEEGVAGVPVGSTIEFLTEDLGGKLLITSLKVISVPKAAVTAAEPKKKSDAPKNPAPPVKKKTAKKTNVKKKATSKK